MKNLIIVLSIVIMVNACSKNNCEPAKIIDCFTTQDINPVCGCNNETYNNKGYADCFQIDYTDGACVENIKDLVGKWEFLGFESDGARMGKPTKEHFYDGMEIEFTKQTFGRSFQYVGKAVVNDHSGAYHSNTNKSLYFSNHSITKVGGSFDQMQFEEKYIEAITNSSFSSFQINGDYLSITFTTFGNTTIGISSDNLVYKRKI